MVCAHVDWSKALAGAEIAATFIQHGARKRTVRPKNP
jgi:hypothetical protein